MIAQLPLGIELRSDSSFSSFVVAHGNRELVGGIRDLAAGTGERYLFFWGAPGVGKTHLLHAACGSLFSARRRVAYVPLGDPGMSPEVLEGLERMELVCLDALDRAAGRGDWELALFRLFNRAREVATRMLVAARAPVPALGMELPDLRSRLAWGPGYHLGALTDADFPAALIRLAESRGLRLPEDTAV